MNILEARANKGKRIVSSLDYLKDGEWYIVMATGVRNNVAISRKESSENEQTLLIVDSSEIELFPDQNIETLSVNIDTSEVKDMLNQVEIRKEIAFLLIQNGHVVDKGFKDTVDNVLDAIINDQQE